MTKQADSANQANQTNAANKSFVKRRRKYIRPDIQVKMILCTFLVGLFLLIFNLQIPLISMMMAKGETIIGFNAIFKMLLTAFGISVCMAIPLSIWVGIVIAFHFCGPIHRITQYFKACMNGRWDGACKLRPKDELHDVADTINDFMGQFNQSHQRQQAVLQEADAFLAQLGDSGTVNPQERDSLRQKIHETAEAFKVRYGDDEQTPASEHTEKEQEAVTAE